MDNSPEKRDQPTTEKLMAVFSQAYYGRNEEVFKQLRDALAPKDPILAAATFAGLGTIGELQSNYLRIANLVHASLIFGRGNEPVSEAAVEQLFNMLDVTSIARDEDPAEDVFISRICTSIGSFRIYEGNWEGAAWFLERFIDILDQMPNGGRRAVIKESIHALLKVSNLVAVRTDTGVNTVPGSYPHKKLPVEVPKDPNVLRKRIEFSVEELEVQGVDIKSLRPFMFNMTDCQNLPFPSLQSLTDLDRRPILDGGNGRFYLFPQSVSPAVRDYILTCFGTSIQNRENLARALIASYAERVQDIRLLGGLTPPSVVEIAHTCESGGCMVSEVSAKVSTGRVLHLVFGFDNFEGNLNNWPTEHPQIWKVEQLKLQERADRIRKHFASQGTLLSGITLFVSCGWGRASGFEEELPEKDNWHFLFITMHDLITLSDYSGMNPLHLWRMVETKKKLESLGGSIININGILNMYGWMRLNDWHIVPHEELPKESLSTELITIPTNCLTDVRVAAKRKMDRQVINGPEGDLVRVIRYPGEVFFAEDESVPAYASIESARKSMLLGVYVSDDRNWWCELSIPNRSMFAYRIWDGAMRWVPRIAKAVCETGYSVSHTVVWCIIANEVSNEKLQIDAQIYSEQSGAFRITTSVTVCPNGVFARPDNAGERAMVESFLKELLGDGSYDIESILSKVFPNNDVKFFHVFRPLTFNDHVADYLPAPVLVERLDDTSLRLGLGWVGGVEKGFLRIRGRNACTAHLNLIVDNLWQQMAEKLKPLDRRAICNAAVLNIERIRRERTVWQRTIRANSACYKDKSNVIDVASRQIGQLDTATLGSRLLVETAVCTSSSVGRAPDELELSQLLSYGLLLFNLGAWSDAISFGLYPPKLNISIFGQVMMDYGFEREVLQPYQLAFAKKQREKEANEYEKLYEQPVDVPAAREVFPERFLAAWKEEYGVSYDVMRKIVDNLEDWGISQKTATYELRKSDLLKALQGCVSPEEPQDIALFVSKLSLPMRDRWDQNVQELPKGMAPQDWYPWNFRRKLSFISRPLVELDASDDPMILISPGAVRESIGYLSVNAFNGTFDERNFSTEAMRKWIGWQRSELGKQFNLQVAEKMREFGWNAESDVSITKLLNRKTELNFGDVDVLAWSESCGVVVAIECKNLFFAKTHREIGNQINEFRGVCTSSGKKDRLRKHFDRLDLLVGELDALRRYTACQGLTNLVGALVFSRSTIIECAPQIPRNRLHVCTIDALDTPAALVGALTPWSREQM